MKKTVLYMMSLLVALSFVTALQSSTDTVSAANYNCTINTKWSKAKYVDSDGDYKKIGFQSYVSFKHCTKRGSHYDDIYSAGVRFYPAQGGNMCGKAYDYVKNMKFNPDSIAGKNYGELTKNCYWSGATKVLDFTTKRYWNGAGGGERCLNVTITDVNTRTMFGFRDMKLSQVCAY